RRSFPMFIPNNTGDLVAKSWWGGRDNDIANYRAAKEIYPTRLPENAAVHYLWQITDSAPHHLVHHIQRLAQAVSSFGWGINMVVAAADIVDTSALPATPADSEEWFPPEADGGTSLRIPVGGTLTALEERHQAFLTRLPTASDGVQYFQPVPPLE